MKKSLVLLALTAALLAGCSGTGPVATHENVTDLRDAFVKAGGECKDWSETNKVEIASQSGECGTGTVLSVYLSSDAVERRIEATKSSIFGDSGNDWLVGENWIINTEDIGDLRDKMGGRVVSFQAK
jgi:hypothetical protein